ncbi:MAG: signal peptidase I [Clostridia bacterium]|nr:signal peptidase I [Clostridia bacterium]
MKKENEKGRKKSAGREIAEWVLTILAAVMIALVIRSFVFEPVRVEGDSMNGTLTDGEIMLVTKYDYASVWLSFPWQSDEEKEAAARVTTGGEPSRFDVVICHYPGRGDTKFVKRVVGLPGDTVQLTEGYLYVNGEKYDEPYIADEYRTAWKSDGYSFGPATVPEGCYFVMGDHRNNSNDSRYVGAIERSCIIGHVRRVLLPFGNARTIE